MIARAILRTLFEMGAKPLILLLAFSSIDEAEIIILPLEI